MSGKTSDVRNRDLAGAHPRLRSIAAHWLLPLTTAV